MTGLKLWIVAFLCGAFLVDPARADLDLLKGLLELPRAILEDMPTPEKEIAWQNGLLKNDVDANTKYFVFSTVLNEANPEEQVGLAVYRFATSSVRVLKPARPEHGYIRPRFSRSEPDVVYVIQTDLRFPEHQTLRRCNVVTLMCADGFTLHGSISDPVEVPEGLLLAFGAPRRDSRFTDRDFYLLGERGQLERLSFMEYAVLTSVNVLDDRIVFQATSPSREAQGWLKASEPSFKVGQPSSEIRIVRFKGSVRNLKFDASSLQPYAIVDASLSTGPSYAPSMIAGSPLLAFQNGWTGGKNYRYSLVVRHMETGEQDYVVADTYGMSNPIVIDADRIVYYELDHDAYSIRSYSFARKRVDKVTEIAGSKLRHEATVIHEGEKKPRRNEVPATDKEQGG